MQKVTLQTFEKVNAQQKRFSELSNFVVQFLRETHQKFQNTETQFLQEKIKAQEAQGNLEKTVTQQKTR